MNRFNRFKMFNKKIKIKTISKRVKYICKNKYRLKKFN